jgi:hypothetical protein
LLLMFSTSAISLATEGFSVMITFMTREFFMIKFCLQRLWPP